MCVWGGAALPMEIILHRSFLQCGLCPDIMLHLESDAFGTSGLAAGVQAEVVCLSGGLCFQVGCFWERTEVRLAQRTPCVWSSWKGFLHKYLTFILPAKWWNPLWCQEGLLGNLGQRLPLRLIYLTRQLLWGEWSCRWLWGPVSEKSEAQVSE